MTANEFLSKAATKLFGSYWSVKDTLTFLNSEEVADDAASFIGYADVPRCRSRRR